MAQNGPYDPNRPVDDKGHEADSQERGGHEQQELNESDNQFDHGPKVIMGLFGVQ